ncbi:MAG: precorrin-3B C(17)-methyltransferase, partial [Alphaproteobacteria bacterium]
MTPPPVILVLSALGGETARRIKAGLPQATIHGLSSRVEAVDAPFDNFGETIRRHYRDGHPILA